MGEIKYIVNAVRWLDKINGNTYHSVRVTRCSDKATITNGCIEYGYGDQYKQTALKLMLKHSWITGYTDNNVYNYDRDNNYPIYWHVTDSTKKDCKNNAEA